MPATNLVVGALQPIIASLIVNGLNNGWFTFSALSAVEQGLVYIVAGATAAGAVLHSALTTVVAKK